MNIKMNQLNQSGKVYQEEKAAAAFKAYQAAKQANDQKQAKAYWKIFLQESPDVPFIKG
jgi:hypothetical protein